MPETEGEKAGEEMRKRVEAALEKIRPVLNADGGDIELLDVRDGSAWVLLVGACAGCAMSTMTLTEGVERMIRQEVPEIKEIVAF